MSDHRRRLAPGPYDRAVFDLMERRFEWLAGDDLSPGDAVLGDGSVTLTAPPETDWFRHPNEVEFSMNAPALVTPVDGDVWFVARVRPEFGATFDAGVLFVHQGPEDFAKLCFEQAPDGRTMVVSVVTRGVSDDANGPVVTDEAVHLRVTRTKGIWAFHHSADGRRWDLLRLFSLRDSSAPTTLGMLAQSPMGEGCAVTFDQLGWASIGLADPRNGS